MKIVLYLTLAATLMGCSIQIPDAWLDANSGRAVPLGNDAPGYGDELAAHRRRYKADPSQPSQIVIDFSAGRPRIAATTLLNQEGMELQATAGCGACHLK